MKLSTETSTNVINKLQDLNQEIRAKLSSMHSCTEQEIKKLDKWLEETQKMEQDLKNISLLITLHLEDFEREYQKHRQRVISKD